jgi:hypothetical protein
VPSSLHISHPRTVRENRQGFQRNWRSGNIRAPSEERIQKGLLVSFCSVLESGLALFIIFLCYLFHFMNMDKSQKQYSVKKW